MITFSFALRLCKAGARVIRGGNYKTLKKKLRKGEGLFEVKKSCLVLIKDKEGMPDEAEIETVDFIAMPKMTGLILSQGGRRLKPKKRTFKALHDKLDAKKNEALFMVTGDKLTLIAEKQYMPGKKTRRKATFWAMLPLNGITIGAQVPGRCTTSKSGDAVGATEAVTAAATA